MGSLTVITNLYGPFFVRFVLPLEYVNSHGGINTITARIAMVIKKRFSLFVIQNFPS